MKSYPNRPAMYRLGRIDEEVRSGKLPTSQDLAASIEVSARTIQRDIEYMHDVMGAPIAYDEVEHGYRYEKAGYSLPAAKLTEGELVSLLVGTKVLEQYGGTPFEADLRKAFQRIALLLPEEVSLHLRDLASATSFAITAPRPPDLRKFSRLTAAVRERKRLRILYDSLSGGRTETREIEPYHMACLDGAWYLIAYCRLRREIRMFVPERILDLTETGDTFDVPVDFDFDEYMAGAFKVMRGGKPRKVRLLFTGKTARYVCERCWHPSQKVAWKDAGCVLEMKVSAISELAEPFKMQAHP